MRSSSILRTTVATVFAVVLLATAGSRPTWAAVGDCNNGTGQVVSGTIANGLDASGYIPGCSILVLDDNSNVFVGSCTSPTAYSVSVAGAVNGNLTLVLTWNPGPNGIPTNQPAVYIFDSGVGQGYVNGSQTTCVQNFIAASGPNAITLKSFSAIASSGGSRLPLAPAAMVLAATVIVGRRWSRSRNLVA